MLLSAHASFGVLTGALTRRPVVAFALGPVSHLLLDAVPHVGSISIALPTLIALDAGVALAVVVGSSVAAPDRRTAAAMLTGVMGAVLLDLDKPFERLVGGQLWPDWLHGAHRSVQHHLPGVNDIRVDVAAVALFVGASVWLAISRRRRRATP